MTLHSLVLISDSFSCNCNSIQSPVSIVHLRVNLILSYPLLRLYINYSISNANHFQLAQQCIQISTRINSSSVHTYIFVCFTLRVILQGFVTQNATTPREQCMLGDNGNKRAIRILLECILVQTLFLVDGSGGSRIFQTGGANLKGGAHESEKIRQRWGKRPLESANFQSSPLTLGVNGVGTNE